MKDETQFCQRKSLVRANSWGLASRHEGKAVSRRTTSFVVVLVVGTAALCSPAEAQQTFYRPPAVTSIRRLHKQNRQRNIAQKRQEPPPRTPPPTPHTPSPQHVSLENLVDLVDLRIPGEKGSLGHHLHQDRSDRPQIDRRSVRLRAEEDLRCPVPQRHNLNDEAKASI